MRMRNLFVLAATCILFALPAKAGADQFLADFRGFDYEDPDVGIAFGATGDEYNSLGLVTQVNPALLTADFTNNEYTYQFRDLTAVSQEFAPPFQSDRHSIRATRALARA